MNQASISPLATRLKRSIWAWATLAALLIASGQGLLSYWHVQKELADELRHIARTSVPLLSVSLWDIEPDAVQWQIETLAERPEIGFVRLRVPTGQLFAAGKMELAELVEPSVYTVPQPGRPINAIGRLEVFPDPAAFHRELLYLVVSSMLAYGILTFLICGLVGYFLRRHLELPLRQLAAYLGALTPEQLRQPLNLQRATGQPRDEIDLIVGGVNVMQRMVDQHVTQLDQLVAQRTADLQAALASIEEISRIDPLTACFNRRAFTERFNAEFGRAERYGQPLSLIFCDIDHFKRINDRYGHPMGDAVLRGVKTCFDACLRENVDWVARYGGEEFVIVLPHTGLSDAIQVAERLRQRIESQLGQLAGLAALPVTASLGVATHGAGGTAAGLLETADSRLYAAKQAGRNCVIPAPVARA